MATTWGDLKDQLVDLGFEEDEIKIEYARLIRTSVNRALDIIRFIDIPEIEDYYKATKSWGYEDEDGEWVLPKPKHVTEHTEDDARINLPDNIMPLLPLLSAYHIWLDDDITKATMYWNEYDQYKNQLFTTCKKVRNAVIEGGF